MSPKNGLELIKQITKYMADTKGFDRVLQNVKIVSGGNGNCLAEFKVQEEHLNRGSTLHGGLSATLVDCISTIALMSKESPPGVSVNLNVSYLKAAREGDIVEVDAKTVKAGKTLAYLSCDIRNKATGDILATGTHVKFIGSK